MHTPRTVLLPAVALVTVPLLAALGAAPRDSAAAPETLAELVRSDPVAAAQGPDAAATCGMCHTEIYAEWKGRKHAVAWTDEIYQEAINSRTRPQLCHACHIPGPVLDRVGSRPRVRDRHLEEGVTCVACHKQGDTMHGPYGSDTLAHPCAKNEAFSFEGSIQLCSSCHATQIGPVMPVAKDFAEADMASKGKSCIGCHMPEVERQISVSLATGNPVGEVRQGRRHSLLGPGDPEFAATAFEFAAAARGAELVLSIRDMAGHRIPALALRKFRVAVRQLDAGGKSLSEDEIVLTTDNALQAESSRDFPFELAAGTAAVEVRVDHLLQDELVATILTRRLEL